MDIGLSESSEKPLSGFSRFSLFCCAGATILLAYLLSIVSLVALLVLLGLEAILALVLLRFGLVGFIARAVGSHVTLFGVLIRSFFLRKGADDRIELNESQAPPLFALIRQLCQKARLQMPRKVAIEMSSNAWVQLSGYRRGAGRTVLGIGFDLLAGLSGSEMEGVLAHELTHAKLVQRGYKNWMNRGLGRMSKLSRGLHAHIENSRAQDTTAEPATLLFRWADRLTRLAARFVAACSRQDEFDADRGAAELCGPAAIRSSLLKLQSIHEKAALLPWNERVARLQLGQGFTSWLIEELSSSTPSSPGDGKGLFFKYSTHPSLSDRLAALPHDTAEALPNSSPAVGLLADPDQIAEMLISKIQSLIATAELKDTKRLRKLTSKSRMQTEWRPLEGFAVLLIAATLLFGICAWSFGALSPLGACIVFCIIFMGVFLYRLGRFRERLPLPIPTFSTIKASLETRTQLADEQVKALELEIKSSVADLPRKKQELALAETCYEALSRCDYLKAHLAASLCLQVNAKSIEGAVGIAVTAAAFGHVQQAHQALRFLHRLTAMSAPSLTWSAAWCFLLCGDWVSAEAFLNRRCQQINPTPALNMLLAYARLNAANYRARCSWAVAPAIWSLTTWNTPDFLSNFC